VSDAVAEVVLEQTDSLDSVRADWARLAERSKNVFATWEWAAAWWRHLRPRGDLLVTTCRRGDEPPFAVLPLYVSKTAGLRVVRFVGHGPADELGPICAPVDRPAAAAALARALDDAAADVFVGDELHAGWSTRLGAHVRSTIPSPVLRLEWGTWDEFLASRSSGFRQQLRRRERALTARGLRYRICDDQDRLDSDLDLLFALHRRQWRGASNFDRIEPFHRDFAAAAFARGWLRLWFLEADGAAVAASYALRFAGNEWGYQAGRDPLWDRFAVGTLVRAHCIRDSIAVGVDEYHLGRGGERYKRHFTDDESMLETIALALGSRGRIALAVSELARGGRRAVLAVRNKVAT
jgi:CelD/BcsL family acetyltransferase involved in cellulose biosynthesis